MQHHPLLLLSLAVLAAALPSSATAGTDLCIPYDADFRAKLSRDGARLTYCFKREDVHAVETCRDVKLATGAWQPSPRPLPPVELGGDPVVRVDGEGLFICMESVMACTRWKRPADLPDGDYESFVVDEARSRLVIAAPAGRPVGDQLRLSVYDLDAGTRLASELLPYLGHQKGAFELRDLQLVDDAILLDVSLRPGPCAQAWIYDLGTLRRIGRAGLKGCENAPPRPVRLGPDQWAFHDSYGESVVIQSVRTGKVSKKIRIDADLADPNAVTRPRPQGDVVIIGGGGFVAVVQPRTGTVTKVSAPQCAED